MSNENSSGRIWIEQGVIHYELSNGGWQLPISEIRVMGEHTDDHGPSVDDYFFVFLTNSHFCEASFYAEGRDQFLSELRDLLGAKLSCGLVNSTDFQSRVMWPPDIAGQPFYDFVPMPKPEGFLAGLKHRLLPKVAYHFTDAVKGEVARCQ
ncbi:MAG TPA: hypothetical protein VM911_02490 [Pyrinomonadaceae bacterium]|jgi:hypothetical protein|nr:hypothetical protein [Pyrinomonadaceae bacterium]